MRFTCQSWGILHSEKRGELADQARGFSRVAAAPYPGYLLCRFFAGWRSNYAKMALQIASLTCCVEALPFMSGVFGPQAIVCSIAARMPS